MQDTFTYRPCPPRHNALVNKHRLIVKLALVVCTAAGLAGCQTTTTSPTEGVAKEPLEISTRQAFVLFETVCGASAPSFASATQRMKANGFETVVKPPSGPKITFSNTFDASFKLEDGPNGAKACSMAFANADSLSKYNKTIAELNPKKINGKNILLHPSGNLVSTNPALKKSGKSYYVIQMISGV